MRAKLAFWDQSGISDRPTVRRTWAERGQTPIIPSAGRYTKRVVTGAIVTTPSGGKPSLFFRMDKKDVDAKKIVAALKQLRRHLRGKVILLWDRLPAHRSKHVQAFLATQTDWLTVEWFPSYAPELNPIEHLWSSVKRKDAGNFCPDTVEELDGMIRKAARRIRRHPDVLAGCLKASELFR
jgi:transposase